MALTFPRRHGSSPATLVKQEHFERVLRQELAMAWAAIKKPRPEWPTWAPWRRVLYIDLNAGPGWLDPSEDADLDLRCSDPRPEPIKGSPLITLRAALDEAIPIKMVLCEKDRAHCRDLYEALVDEVMDYHLETWGHESACDGCAGCDRWLAAEYLDELVTILEGDHNETIPALLAGYPEVWGGKRPFFGLIYADPYGAKGANGPGLLPMEALSRVPCLSRVEILINVSATAYKRARRAGAMETYLFADLAPIKRAHRWIREPVGRWQWTMILATNTPRLTLTRSLGFHRSDTPEGAALIDRLNISAHERRGPAHALDPHRPPEDRAVVGRPVPDQAARPGGRHPLDA